MGSALFAQALAALGDEGGQWDEVKARLTAVLAEEGWDAGAAMVALIEAEEQLSDDPSLPCGAALAEFVRSLNASLAAAPADAAELRSAYERACDEHCLGGRLIKLEPTRLFHYAAGSRILNRLVESLTDDTLVGDLDFEADAAQRLGDLLAAAQDLWTEGGDPAAAWDAVLVELRALWNDLVAAGVDLRFRFPQVELILKGRAFITFDHEQEARRDDAPWMHSALGLPRECRDCLLEWSFDAQPADELRYPTCADAGWFAAFRCAGTDAPYGWTKPHSGVENERQPEVVMATPTLARIAPQDLRVRPLRPPGKP